MIDEAREFENFPWTFEQLQLIKMDEEYFKQCLKEIRGIKYAVTWRSDGIFH